MRYFELEHPRNCSFATNLLFVPIVQFQETSMLPAPQKVFLFYTPFHQGHYRLDLYFASKILAFKTPLPPGISNDFPWGGYGFFS